MNKNIEPTLIENKIIIGNSTLKGTLVEKGFGESKGNKLILDLFEAIYLMEKEKIKIIDVKEKKSLQKKYSKLE